MVSSEKVKENSKNAMREIETDRQRKLEEKKEKEWIQNEYQLT